MSEPTRQLAAIMFTDIVGYTALMGMDESAALALLKSNRQIHINKIREHNGKLLKEMGDGILASFGTISDSILCAIALQGAASGINQLQLRIGIHVGEVVVEDGDVFGSGVNIASRIESMAVSGSILVSEQVYNEIKNNRDIPAKRIGKFNLKNIEKPLDIYAIANEGMSVPSKEDITFQNLNIPGSSLTLKITPKLVSTVLIIIALVVLGYFLIPDIGGNNDTNIGRSQAASETRTIAVLAFDDVSPEGDQEWLGDGMADEILNLLAKVDGLQVTGKTSSFSFKGKDNTITEIGEILGVKSVLEGSVIKVGNKLRITAQLIDVETDKHIWSNKYDRDYDEIIAIIDDVAQSISSSLVSELSIEDLDKIKVAYEGDPEAYEYYLKGQDIHLHRYIENKTVVYFEQAEKMFIKAITIDETYAEAYAGLADLYDSRSLLDNSYAGKRDSVLSLGYMIDSTSVHLIVVNGWRFMHQYSRNIDSAFYFFKKAYDQEPNNVKGPFADFFKIIGIYYKSIPIYNEILINDPLFVYMSRGLAQSLEGSGAIGKSRQVYLSLLEVDPYHLWANTRMLGIVLFHDHDKSEAKKILDNILKIDGGNKFAGALLLAMDGQKEDALNLAKNLYVYSLLDMKKEAISRVDSLSVVSEFTDDYTYISLNNWKVLDFIREEAAFKEVLAKAKIVHEERLRKYGHLFEN